MSKKFIFGTLAVAIVSLVLFFVTGLSSNEPKLPFSQVLEHTKNGDVQAIYNYEPTHHLTVILNSDPSTRYQSDYPDGSLFNIMTSYGVPLTKLDVIQDSESDGDGLGLRGLFILVAILSLASLGVRYLRNRFGNSDGESRPGNNRMAGGQFGFNRSSAKIVVPQKVGVTFQDVAGADEAKQELEEIVEFLRFPDKFKDLGARIPKGVLLVGPPGTGKTLLAKAVAGEANVPFLSVSGSEFVEMYVGVGAARVRDLFARAKKLAPCIIFIDEVDAVGRKRGMRSGGGSEEREQTLNQILVEMDGFDSNTNVIILAATNRVDVLDPAFLRPGRFDRQVMVDNPDFVGRSAILKVHAKGKPLAADVDLDRVARQTPGFSGADLANLMNEAAILTARRNKKAIGLDELEEGLDRVIAGPERKSRVISEREKLITAYHEVGHALVAKVSGNVDPVQKISIVARGRMGGYTRVAAEQDRSLWTKSQLESFMAFALGGHCAEDIMFGDVTTGPSNDIEKVTNIARSMVCEYGMSEVFGPVKLTDQNGEGSYTSGHSNNVAWQVDQEVDRLIKKALNQARSILTRYNEHMIAITNYLLEKEVISGTEMDEIFNRVEREGLGPNTIPMRLTAPDLIKLGSNETMGVPTVALDAGTVASEIDNSLGETDLAI